MKWRVQVDVDTHGTAVHMADLLLTEYPDEEILLIPVEDEGDE